MTGPILDPRVDGVDPRRALGAFGEDAVARWYADRGAAILDRNWRVREGEIDLVVMDRATVVIVEVKTRRSTKFGLPVEAITPAKAARLRRLAGLWLHAHRQVRANRIRIDIASVFVDRSGSARVEVVPLDV
jgi:putative endonuclease